MYEPKQVAFADICCEAFEGDDMIGSGVEDGTKVEFVTAAVSCSRVVVIKEVPDGTTISGTFAEVETVNVEVVK